jgi:hypothetical protein
LLLPLEAGMVDGSGLTALQYAANGSGPGFFECAALLESLEGSAWAKAP